MPTDDEIAAGVKDLQAARERSRTHLTPYPTPEDEVRIVLEAAERVRAAKG